METPYLYQSFGTDKVNHSKTLRLQHDQIKGTVYFLTEGYQGNSHITKSR